MTMRGTTGRIEGHGALSPATSYFEIDSRHVGDRFAIWVTVPPRHRREPEAAFPLLYLTDGDGNALVAAAVSQLFFGDHLRPGRQFIQVAIGYADRDPGRRFIRRNRDFQPPGEPVSELLERHIGAPAYAAALGEAGLAAFLAQARDGRADRFLAFIEDELHAEITRRFCVDSQDVGLFGHSQGGLFTLYAMTSGARLFRIYGAASPAIVTPESRVFGLRHEQLATGPAAERALRAHLTVNDLELTGAIEYYRAIGRGYLSFVDLLRRRPTPRLRVTTEIITGETHFSGVLDGYRSFLRACWLR